MSAQIRALEVVTTRLTTNGISGYVLSHMEKMAQAGAGAGIVCDVVSINVPDESILSIVRAQGGRVYPLPMRNRNPLSYMKKLAALVQDGNYDLVHVHGNSCTMLADLTAANCGGAAVRIAHAHNTRCKQALLHRLLRKPFDKSYTAAAACGQAAGEFLFAGKPFTILKNGVDTARFRFDPDARALLRGALGLDGCHVYFHAGSFNEQKNQAYLLEPFARHLKKEPAAALVFAGDGPGLFAARRAAAALGIQKNVRFLGRRSDVPALLSAADAFLLPSHYEGFPIALIEAQAAGLPCLIADTVTKDAAVTPLVRFLPLADDPAVWADAMAALIRPTEDERKTAADCVRETGFDLSETAAALAAQYREWAKKP